MDDLISRQAAVDALGEKPLVWDDLNDFDLGKAVQWSDDVDAIKALPPAQPKRIKGKWKRTKANRGYNAEWTCSNCGYTVYAEFCNYNYCSSCGSDMRGEDDE